MNAFQMRLIHLRVQLFTLEFLNSYDRIIVYFSGGKDSLACLLWVINMGVEPSRIELWHHEIDGREGSNLMDWPITAGYCRTIAEHFGIPLYFSWKMGGFEREMMRHDQPTAPTRFETPSGVMQAGGTSGRLGTREQFPQVSADLSVRYCSPYLKIDVAATAIRNDPRFAGMRTLTVSGERAQESPARAKYQTFEPDRSDNRDGKSARLVDRLRPIHSWTEEHVWKIIERFKVNPHPAYSLGWGRVSCMFCIFGSADQWATARKVDPARFEKIAQLETQFGKTIHRKLTVGELADRGTAYPFDPAKAGVAMGTEFTEPAILENWVIPMGAYGDLSGPC
jgi:3'-phosphoadenosine 5'-phosphosulfate sulfotransferase (PAPS reductase)/FAD synthetase